MKFVIIDRHTGREYWTTKQCAAHLGIAPDTWSSYASRGQGPAPVGKFERLTVWDADQVIKWGRLRRQ